MDQKIRQDRHAGGKSRELREQKHLTQDQVAIKLQLQGLDFSRSMYSQMECGTYKLRVTELDVLVELFRVDYNTIFNSD